MGATGESAVLDACVLYPTVLREALLAAAAAEGFRPLWSARILEEWRRAAIRVDGGAGVEADIAEARQRFPDAMVAEDAALEARLSLPDDNDRHVLATAITGEAPLLVTLNLRDFPGRTLARHAIRPCHPDVLLLELVDTGLVGLRAGIEGVVTGAALATGLTRRSVLKRARLPRLGKALEEGQPKS